MENISLRPGEHASHAYIVASPSAAERTRASRRLAAAIICEGAGERPCGRCRACRKSLAGIHPDIAAIAPGQDAEGKKSAASPSARCGTSPRTRR